MTQDFLEHLEEVKKQHLYGAVPASIYELLTRLWTPDGSEPSVTAMQGTPTDVEEVDQLGWRALMVEQIDCPGGLGLPMVALLSHLAKKPLPEAERAWLEKIQQNHSWLRALLRSLEIDASTFICVLENTLRSPQARGRCRDYDDLLGQLDEALTVD